MTHGQVFTRRRRCSTGMLYHSAPHPGVDVIHFVYDFQEDLDRTYPDERLTYMAQDAGLVAFVTADCAGSAVRSASHAGLAPSLHPLTTPVSFHASNVMGRVVTSRASWLPRDTRSRAGKNTYSLDLSCLPPRR